LPAGTSASINPGGRPPEGWVGGVCPRRDDVALSISCAFSRDQAGHAAVSAPWLRIDFHHQRGSSRLHCDEPQWNGCAAGLPVCRFARGISGCRACTGGASPQTWSRHLPGGRPDRWWQCRGCRSISLPPKRPGPDNSSNTTIAIRGPGGGRPRSPKVVAGDGRCRCLWGHEHRARTDP